MAVAPIYINKGSNPLCSIKLYRPKIDQLCFLELQILVGRILNSQYQYCIWIRNFIFIFQTIETLCSKCL